MEQADRYDFLGLQMHGTKGVPVTLAEKLAQLQGEQHDGQDAGVIMLVSSCAQTYAVVLA